MATATDRARAGERRDALDQAHARRDAGAFVALHAPDAVIMDLAPPLAQRGLRRDEVQDWLDAWDGPIRLDSRDPWLVRDGALASSARRVRTRGRQQGRDQDLRFRSSHCLRRIDGRSLIVRAHSCTRARAIALLRRTTGR